MMPCKYMFTETHIKSTISTKKVLFCVFLRKTYNLLYVEPLRGTFDGLVMREWQPYSHGLVKRDWEQKPILILNEVVTSRSGERVFRSTIKKQTQPNSRNLNSVVFMSCSLSPWRLWYRQPSWHQCKAHCLTSCGQALYHRHSRDNALFRNFATIFLCGGVIFYDHRGGGAESRSLTILHPCQCK